MNMRVPFSGKASAMSDVATASSLVQNTWQVRQGRNAKSCIGAAFEAVKRIERRLPIDVLRDRPRQWTERRVQTIWKKQARRIDNYEMLDLEQAALEAARGEFDASIKRAARLAAFISAHAETEGGELVSKLRELVG
ncbi:MULTISPECIES: hypothetical protein [unclassified Mesorhizobium]|uniref:hypothetical protein n=2 Tax=Phyllobacteriaceae TaxID=69277 RepID=UPI000FC9CBE0|nr:MULTISPECIES: hypothetical protein [unclassified Mesorhizobium]RVC26711.1 hypothetical protein EN879_00650 [Mesorhizobium sp. M7A.F.Ca.AU.002.02.1.1]TPI93307.1 hypothetical protein FJ438_03200 [Mesorhizobium sp. B2-8-7]MDF3208423.1 hypothetical protein [Mesorhizobium sp. LMG15046]RUU22123.1 hypothetical protein EOC84_03160 [Mesorhizobium sp. Primo-B]TPI89279.1 hypothetical protein FJ421_07865 [Mesorhizobium sp. B2-8-8]